MAPPKTAAERATGPTVRADVVAGLTVALVGLPQCLAYALMSGLPPAYGLSTAAVAGLVAALAGRSPHVVTGPTNTTGLLILAALAPFLGDSGLLTEAGLPALATLTLMAGLFRIAAAFLGGARLLRYLPESVLAGFTAGAGVLIGIMQLDEALGMKAFVGGGLWSQVTSFATRLSQGRLPSPADMSVAATCVGAIVLGRRYAPRAPVALASIVLAALAAWALEGTVALRLVRDRAQVPSGWPPGALPSLDPELWLQFSLPALAIVLLGTLELTVSARADGARPDMNREIQAQGWANVVGAFASAFPASASLTRSALLRLGGARSRLAAATAAVFVVPILLFGGAAVGYIPQAALAGVLLITAAGMIKGERLRRIWNASRSSRAMMVVTFAATLTLPLEIAILLGCGLGILIHLAVTAAPRITWLRLEGDALVPLEPGATAHLAIAEVSGTLYFAAVPALMERLEGELPLGLQTLVLDLSHAHELRFSALESFERLDDLLEARGGRLALAGVTPDFVHVLARAKSQLTFEPASPVPTASLRALLARL